LISSANIGRTVFGFPAFLEVCVMAESIPRQSLASQRAWAENFTTVVSAAPATYGVTALTAGQWAALYVLFNNAWQAAGVVDRVAVDPANYTQPQRGALYTAATNCMDVLAAAAVTIQASVTISDVNKLAAGVTPRNFSRTPNTLPVESPVLSQGPINSTDMVVRTLNLVGTGAWPIGANRIAFEVALGTMPAGVLTFGPFASQIVNRRRNYYDFSASSTAVKLRIRARYEGRRSQFGPWSTVLEKPNPNFG
jgi:hypothetical protein